MPTIAVVEGYALGGGCELALCARSDRRSAAGRPSGCPRSGLGLVPGGGGTQPLSRRIGLNAAAELIFTGRRVGAEEAARLGLIDRLVPADTARSAALELAGQIATKSPVSLRAAKRALRRASTDRWPRGWPSRVEAWAEAAFSADRREGIAAFNAKRPAHWPSWEPTR